MIGLTMIDWVGEAEQHGIHTKFFRHWLEFSKNNPFEKFFGFHTARHQTKPGN